MQTFFYADSQGQKSILVRLLPGPHGLFHDRLATLVAVLISLSLEFPVSGMPGRN